LGLLRRIAFKIVSALTLTAVQATEDQRCISAPCISAIHKMATTCATLSPYHQHFVKLAKYNIWAYKVLYGSVKKLTGIIDPVRKPASLVLTCPL